MLFIRRGSLWNGPDGKARVCYPVVAAFQVDYPESCLLTLVRVGQACPTCMASKEDFGSIREHRPRSIEDMRDIYERAQKLTTVEADELLKKYGMVNAQVWCPDHHLVVFFRLYNTYLILLFSTRIFFGIFRDATSMPPLRLTFSTS